MKKGFVLLFVFCSCLLYSQKNKLLKVEYEEYKVLSQIANKYKGYLYVSDDFSLYKTDFMVNKKSSEITVEENDNDTSILIPVNYEKLFSEVFINRANKMLTDNIFDNILLKDYFSITEKQPEMEWKLLEEEKFISNYKCKKAKTTFRGRTYEVWYTSEIPVSLGPWKFNGLPGLILSAKDLSGTYRWEATSVVYPYQGNEIDFSKIMEDKPKFTKISFKDYDDKWFKAKAEQSKILKSRVGSDIIITYSTFQWKEPVNEWRTQTEFQY